MSYIVLIGQAPGRFGGEPLLGGRSGSVIARLCGMSEAEYERAFIRMNVLDYWPGSARGKGDMFPLTEARRSLHHVIAKLDGGRYYRLVLLGRKVAHVFGHGEDKLFAWSWDERGFRVAVCPHPSGVNLWWNDSRNVARARRFFRGIAGR